MPSDRVAAEGRDDEAIAREVAAAALNSWAEVIERNLEATT